DIMKDLRARPAASAGEPSTTYTGEDVHVRQYGDFAIVDFRLVGTTERNGRTETARYLNTGVFRKHGGVWQAVSWQATRVPWDEEQVKTDAEATLAALLRALAGGDVKTLEALLDASFVWTRHASEQVTRARFLDEVRSGGLTVSPLETSDVGVAIYGDTAVVRGLVRPAASGGAGPAPARFTLTLGNKGEGWKAIALHSGAAAN